MQSIFGFTRKKIRRLVVRIKYDTIVHVDRSVLLVYPDWVKEVVDHEVETDGPSEYDLSESELWLHDVQKNGWPNARLIYEHLKKNGMLCSCAGLADGIEIQKKGVVIFRELFGEKSIVFLWRSVVLSHGGCLVVPYLHASSNEVLIGWHNLDWLVGETNLALCFSGR